jgi:hypothetical protein
VIVEALTFVIAAVETGRVVAVGLIAPDARYASVGRPGADRPERLHPGSKTWRAILSELGTGTAPGPLPRQSWLFVLLTNNSSSLAVEWISRESVTVDNPAQTVEALDQRLKAMLNGPGA